MLRVFLILFCCIINAAEAEPRIYFVDVQVDRPGKEGNYYVELLTLILNASKSPEEHIEFRFSGDQLSQARWVAEVVQDKGNNVLWTMNSKDRERNLHMIRVPVLKGLMGYRLLVIRKQDEAKFSNINTKEDLLKLSAGQGMHWPDTDILRANEFRLTEAMAKENLYKMLAAKRFDFFPRGVVEVELEDELIQSQELMVEPHLLLHYPADIFFFVSKTNIELAERMERGWQLIQKNGEFEKFFLDAARVKSALDILKKRKRTIIELENPFLPEETLSETRGYWIDRLSLGQ
ncbi:MAG: hypothetical protein EOO53_07010 [Gammaproteobacteria bacterium]|nr:MAG: hypothetical protein EOO53_07010 [Gammaproteobacteria bacterium]